MIIRNVTMAQVEQAANAVGCRFDGREEGVRVPRVHGRLMPPHGSENPYQRVSASYFNNGRKVHAVCWHGFRDFFRELFEIAPNATVQSALTERAGVKRYTAENFEEVFPETGWVNIGAQIMPVSAASACSCPEGSY